MTGKASAYLYVGDDEFSRSTAAHELVRTRVPPAEQAFGLEIVEGRADTVDEAVRQVKACRDALLTNGFLLTAGKLVWWRDVGFLAEGPVARSERVKEQLKQLAGILHSLSPDGNSLLVTASAVDRRSALFKTFKECHSVRDFALPEKAREIEQYARGSARQALQERGLKASSDVLEIFIQRAGADGRQLAGEAEKLALYLGDRRDVTEVDVRTVVCASSSAGIWEFLDAVVEQRPAKAFSALRDLLANKESPIGIVTMLAGRLRDVALYREALDHGWVGLRSHGRTEAVWTSLPPEIEATFTTCMKRDPRTAHPFVMLKLAQQAARFSMAHLKAAQRAVLETHERLVSSSLPEALLLDMMLLRIMRQAGVDRR